MKKALITGIAGQDSVYLAELLLEKGYEVHGIKRHSLPLTNRSLVFCELTCASHPRFYLHYAEITHTGVLARLVQEIEPDELYNLGAMPFSFTPFATSEQVAELNGLHTLRILEAVRGAGLTHKVRVYQNATPNTDELQHAKASFLGKVTSPITANLSGHGILCKYRSTYSMYACNGLAANYELLGRGEVFLPRKITQGAVRTALGLQGLLYVDSLDAYRDWGHAQDYVEAMWRTLQQPAPVDFVIATGVFTTIREFVRLVFMELGIDIVFQGEGVREAGYVVACHNSTFSLMPGQSIIAIDSIYYRPSNVENYLAEGSKARRQLGWKPRYNLHTLIQEMVQHDLHRFQDQYSSAKFSTLVLSSVT